MPDWLVPVLLALIGGGGAGALVTAYIALRRMPTERRATEADTAATLTQSASELVQNLTQQLDRLDKKHTMLEKEYRKTDADLNRLRVDLLSHKERIRRLEQESVKKDRIIENLRNQVNMLQTSGDEKDKIITAQANQIAKLEAQVERLRAHLKRLEEVNSARPA